MSAPLWAIPARAKAGELLPEGATEAEIEHAAHKAMRDVFQFARARGYEIVWPAARLIVEPWHDCEEGRSYIGVRAFAVCAKKEAL